MTRSVVRRPVRSDAPPVPSASAEARARGAAWAIAGAAGVVLALVGAADLALAWIPAAFGSPEWEFATVSASYNAMPVLALGLALSMAAAVARGRTGAARVAAALFAALALAVAAASVLYATSVPIAFRLVEDPVARLGLKKAVAKGAVQSLVFFSGSVWLAIVGWRRAASLHRNP